MSDVSTYSLVLAIVLTAGAAGCDLLTGKIPNRLVALGAASCIAILLLAGVSAGPAALLRALLLMLAGSALVSLVPALLYRAGGIGGGDLKLLAVVGAALGPYLGLEAELYAFVVALLYAPARLIWEGRLGQMLKTLGRMVLRPLLPRDRRPAPVAPEELTALRFAPAIFFGTLTAAVQHLGALR
jgi:prepilin peptidase CpaA